MEKRTMKVLVLGFPRTGTASMQQALRILGYDDVHHMQNVFESPPEADVWMELLRAKREGRAIGREQLDVVLGHCEAVTDAPAVCFSEELLAAYPDAKVILTNRDPDAWWRSFSSTIGTTIYSLRYRLTAYLDPGRSGRFVPMGFRVIDALLGEGYTEETAKRAFVEHYEGIRQVVLQARLLEYEAGQGWAPLCAFLGKPVPEEPFPRVNDAEQFRRRMDSAVSEIYSRALRAAGIATLAAVGVAYTVYWVL